MAFAALDDGRIVLGDTDIIASSGERREANYHAIAPMLLGFSAPLIILSVIDPEALQNVRVLVTALLGSAFVIAVALFAISLLRPGSVATVVVDRDRRTLELVYAGTFANTAFEVDFDEVRTVRMGQVYDPDGFASDHPEILLHSGETIMLPPGTSQSDIASLDAVLGLR